ncbi:unnamed protein product [Gadus morhua 'NCC']
MSSFLPISSADFHIVINYHSGDWSRSQRQLAHQMKPRENLYVAFVYRPEDKTRIGSASCSAIPGSVPSHRLPPPLPRQEPASDGEAQLPGGPARDDLAKASS